MSFTFTQWIILGLVLVLGWVLGLMSRSGGRRYKRELADERRAHETYRRENEARIAALERDRPVHRDAPHHRDGAIDNLDLRDRRP